MNQNQFPQQLKGLIRSFALGELPEGERHRILEVLDKNRSAKEYLNHLENELNLLSENIPYNISRGNGREKISGQIQEMVEQAELGETNILEKALSYLPKLGF